MKEKQLQLVTYEQAKRLKALGFDWEEETFYDLSNMFSKPIPHYEMGKIKFSDYLQAPTIALALKWCRDEKKIWYKIQNNKNSASYFFQENVFQQHTYASYEAAESELLDKILTCLEKRL